MISKEKLIAWLYAHKMLTADLELDIHDCFDAARDAAVHAPRTAHSMAFLSPGRRLETFFIVCRHLDAMVDRGSLDSNEAVIALHILRATDKHFHKAAAEFEHRALGQAPLSPADMPATAREYLISRSDSFTPLVAG